MNILLGDRDVISLLKKADPFKGFPFLASLSFGNREGTNLDIGWGPQFSETPQTGVSQNRGPSILGVVLLFSFKTTLKGVPSKVKSQGPQVLVYFSVDQVPF